MNRCVLALALVLRPVAVYADDEVPATHDDDDDDQDDPPTPVAAEPDAAAEPDRDTLELTDFWARVDALYASGELLLAPWSGREE